jgi:hypothetical protein
MQRRIRLAVIVIICALGVVAGDGHAEEPQEVYENPELLLAQAYSALSEGRVYYADVLFNEAASHVDATMAQVEEARVLQSIIYAGDYLGAVAMMQSFAAFTESDSELKLEIQNQLVNSHIAFYTVVDGFLDVTVAGSNLQTVTVELPELPEKDIETMQLILQNEEIIREINSTYDEDPTAGLTLLARVNRFSLLLSLQGVFLDGMSDDIEYIRSQMAAGQPFSQIRYLDWAAEILVGIDKVLTLKGGPPLDELAARCDDRILALLGADANNVYAEKARNRASEYTE